MPDVSPRDPGGCGGRLESLAEPGTCGPPAVLAIWGLILRVAPLAMVHIPGWGGRELPGAFMESHSSPHL